MAAPLSREQYEKLPKATRDQIGPYPDDQPKPRVRAVKEGQRPIRKVKAAPKPKAAAPGPKPAPTPKRSPAPKRKPAPVRIHTTPSGRRRLVTPVSGGLSVGEVDQAVLVAAGVGLLILYIRGVPQAVWAAATTSPAAPKRPSTAATQGGASGGTSATAKSAMPPPGGALATAGNGLAALANQSIGQTRKPDGTSWLDWCLQFVDDTAAKLGISRKRDATAAADANDTAAFGPLQNGKPPVNALVYFQGNPGHVGISNGDGTYTSAGLPGGIQRLPINWNTLLGWRYA